MLCVGSFGRRERGQEVIWPGVGQTIFLSGPLGTHAAGTSGDSEERSGSQQQQKRLTNDPNLFGEGDDSAFSFQPGTLHPSQFRI